MRRWINVMNHLFSVLILILSVLLSLYKKEWIFGLIISFVFLKFLIDILPNYSTNKFLRYFYNHDFIGEFAGNLKFKTYVESKEKIMTNKAEDKVKKVSFSIEFEGNEIIKKQNSDIGTVSEAHLISSYIKNKKIFLFFKYLHKAKHNNKDETQDGYDILIFDINKKEIIKSEYFNDKPGHGEIIDIKRKKIKP